MKQYFSLLVLALGLAACNNDNTGTENNNSSSAIPAPATLNYTVLNVYPHDTSSFTEGLFLHEGDFLESTGNKGRSKLLQVDIKTGKIKKSLKIADQYFGEGISVMNGKIYQLTYQEHKVFVYDLNFKKLPQEFEWPYEGWGMTTDGKSLIIGTGGSNLYFVNPETFKIERTLGVSNNNGYVSMINELEWVDGAIYANIWQTNEIIKINAQTGLVEAKADFTDILKKNNVPDSSSEAFNGIAYNPVTKSFYVTGKWWPALFEIKFN
ncbi:MAG: glutamine cyclotransferase [Chitinophagaceae bacterium BSSC1]|nr:MAG: glutamine cyclotransferase [Chitinophagaceae bacterium BSSC1]